MAKGRRPAAKAKGGTAGKPGGAARVRSSAEARREEILDAAIQEFARLGLYGTSVDDIAERVGISQPYIFRLFSTKKELFIAAALRVCGRIEQAFDEAARKNPGHSLKAMGHAYVPLLSSRAELLVLLHAFAASGDEEVRSAVSARYAKLWEFVARTSGASREQVIGFFASGMGMTVGAALKLEHLFMPPHDGSDRE
jgi:AcrR family transcriptional regulator